MLSAAGEYVRGGRHASPMIDLGEVVGEVARVGLNESVRVAGGMFSSRGKSAQRREAAYADFVAALDRAHVRVVHQIVGQPMDGPWLTLSKNFAPRPPWTSTNEFPSGMHGGPVEGCLHWGSTG